MSFFALSVSRSRVFRFVLPPLLLLLASLFAFAQLNLKFRMLAGYVLDEAASLNKGKSTLFVFEQEETFRQTFRPGSASGKRPDQPNFGKEMVISIAVPPTKTPPKLSISKIFVQDSTLTVRYIRMADSTYIKNPLSTPLAPTLVVAIPKQTVLRTKLVENGRVVQTIQKHETD